MATLICLYNDYLIVLRKHCKSFWCYYILQVCTVIGVSKVYSHRIIFFLESCVNYGLSKDAMGGKWVENDVNSLFHTSIYEISRNFTIYYVNLQDITINHVLLQGNAYQVTNVSSLKFYTRVLTYQQYSSTYHVRGTWIYVTWHEFTSRVWDVNENLTEHHTCAVKPAP